MNLDYQFKENGYILLKEFFDSMILDEFLRKIHDVFRLQFEADDFSYELDKNKFLKNSDLINFFSSHKNDYIICMKTIQNLVMLHKLGTKSILLETLKKIGLKSPILCSKPQIMINSKLTSSNVGHWMMPVHQDWRSMQGSLNSVVVWLPLIDCPEDLGALKIIRGSHKNGLLPSETDVWYAHVKDEYVKDEKFESVPMKKGDVLIFSTFLLHKSGENITNDFRISAQFRFNDLYESTYVKRKYFNPYPSNPPQNGLFTSNFPTSDDMKNVFKND